jgi:glycosyltransferase involved in cell wall biosynthesis
LTKLIIQIPCYNEESSLPATLAGLTRALPGVDAVEWLVIDDGSAVRTVEVAQAGGVHHVVRLPSHRGLARAFMAGLKSCLKAGAAIIVNLDTDNQYFADDISRLIEPILQHRAEFVVGTRPVAEIEHFSPIKKWQNRLGSRVVQLTSKADIPDAPSGLRAISCDPALRINLFSEFTYTLETIIQAGQKGMGMLAVPIRVNPGTRPFRLVKSVPDYVLKSVATILRIFVICRPLRFFAFLGVMFLVPGLLLGFRFLYFYATGSGAGHVQSVILCDLLLGTGFFLMVTALVVDLIAVNRMSLDRLDWRLKKVEEQLRGNGRNA